MGNINDDKYYIPSIDEFHVGFRFEFAGLDNNWVKLDYQKLTLGKIAPNTGWTPDLKWLSSFKFDNTIDKDTGLKDTDYFRVKYLDNDDIEELGWEKRGKNGFKLLKSCKLDNGYLYETHFNLGFYEVSTMEITDGNGNILFYGKVKNYNELKNLMKWIFI